MKSTFGSAPLTVHAVLQHGRTIHADSEVVFRDGNVIERSTYAEVADGAERLAAALHRLGVRPGDRVATLCWNHRQHLEAYFAIPAMGAVLHTLNLRLPAEQLTFIVNHAADRVILVNGSLLPRISTEILQQMTIGPLPEVVKVGLDDKGEFVFAFGNK